MSSSSSCVNNSKRMRTANYSQNEKNVLVTIVNSYKNIIENKKTDAVTNGEKEKAWQQIAQKFNAVSPENIYRDVQSLKKTYSNIKMQVKKAAADEKTEIYKTGGGRKRECNEPVLMELMLDTINKKTVYGFQNQFDNDYHPLDNAGESVLEQQNIGDANNEYNEHSWSRPKPTNLKLPLDPNLKKKVAAGSSEKHCDNLLEAATPPKVSRRRPTGAVALHSSELAKIYSEVGQQKLEVTKLEKAILEHKLAAQAEKHKVEMMILEIDLKIKQQHLHRLQLNMD
ncbi:hypothetical protein RI129_003281 [Pyrocoelia pectoralis]|uniref:Regulatory protein zeste n=1 Tax=Pyrocoelia pectoralis TaxID=417401 RepID=A0AAN7VQV0_9COLE